MAASSSFHRTTLSISASTGFKLYVSICALSELFGASISKMCPKVIASSLYAIMAYIEMIYFQTVVETGSIEVTEDILGS